MGAFKITAASVVCFVLLVSCGTKPEPSQMEQKTPPASIKTVQLPPNLDTEIAWWLNQAFENAEQIEGSGNQAEPLCAIAEANAREGRYREALAAARIIKDEQTRLWGLRELARIQAEKGLSSEALLTASEAKTKEQATGIIADIIASLRMNGNKAEAETIIDSIKDPGMRKEVLDMARRLEQEKQTKDEQEVRYKVDEEYKAVCPLVEEQITGGDYAKALEIATSANYPKNKNRLINSIVVAQMDAGLLDEAVETLGKKNPEWINGATIIAIANRLAKAGKPDIAQAILSRLVDLGNLMRDPVDRTDALLAVAKAATQICKQDDAGKILSDIAASVAASGNDGYISASLRQLADMMMGTGRKDDAAAALRKAKATMRQGGDFKARRDDLLGIAGAQARAGAMDEAALSFSEAADTTKSLSEDNPLITQSLVLVAEGQNKAGLADDATRTLRRATETAKKVTAFGPRMNALIPLAKAEAEMGYKDDAAKIFQDLLAAAKDEKNSNLGSTNAVLKIASAQVDAGFIEAAKETAMAVESTDKDTVASKARILGKISAQQATAGKIEEAKRTFAESFALAKAMNSNRQYDTLRTISDMMCEAGMTEEAIQAAQDSDTYREGALENIVRAQIEKKDFEKALDILRKLGFHDYPGHTCFRSLATAQLEGGMLEQAIETAKLAGPPKTTANILIYLAITAQKGGKAEEATRLFAEARSAVLGLTESLTRTNFLYDMAREQIAINLFLEASLTAGLIEDLSRRVDVLLLVAQAQAKNGDKQGTAATYAEAYSVAQKIDDPRYKFSALAGVATGKVRNDDRQNLPEALSQMMAAQADLPNDSEVRSGMTAVLFSLVQVECEAGLIEEAKAAYRVAAVVRSYESSTRKILAEIIKAQSKAGLLDDALAFARESGDSRAVIQCICDIADDATATNKNRKDLDALFSEAVSLANGLANAEDKIRALTYIACTQLRTGNSDSASKTFSDAVLVEAAPAAGDSLYAALITDIGHIQGKECATDSLKKQLMILNDSTPWIRTRFCIGVAQGLIEAKHGSAIKWDYDLRPNHLDVRRIYPYR